MNMKLLIVEDDADFAAALSRAMGKRGFETAVAHDAVEARSVATAFSPSHAVVDLKLPGESGLAVVATLAARSMRMFQASPPAELRLDEAYQRVVADVRAATTEGLTLEAVRALV